MNKIIEEIIDSTTITSLIYNLNQLLSRVNLSNDMEVCKQLANKIDNKINSFNNDDRICIFDETQSPIFLLYSYLCGYVDDEDILSSIQEFIENCASFAEDEKSTSINAGTVVEMLANCENNCGGISFITQKRPLRILQFDNINLSSPYQIREVPDLGITLSLFKLMNNSQPELYIGNALGGILYGKLEKKLGINYLHNELCRYIPQVRGSKLNCTRDLFNQYFVQTMLFKQKKPQIMNCYDNYLKSVIVCNFFNRIIKEALSKQ